MIDPRQVAVQILGPIEWESEVTGFCKCPGEGLHTHANGKKHCRVSIDGAPTIYCFHSSCTAAVAEANLRLRRELGGHTWSLRLPGGAVVRAGDVVAGPGLVVRGAQSGVSVAQNGVPVAQTWAPVSQTGVPGAQTGGGGAQTGGGGAQTGVGGAQTGGGVRPGLDRAALDLVAVHAERFRPQLFDFFRWPMAQILVDSPLVVADRESDEQFRTWLKLWPADSTVWVGDVFSSGKPEHNTHFRAVAEWYQIGPVMGNYTCGSAFKPGVHSRSNENLSGFRFLVIESDTLSRDEVGAIFAYLSRRLHYTLHAIVDTAGKSLHGWFDAPRTVEAAARLKAGLVVFGCDPKVFTWSQPVRVPGAFRDGRLQRLVWLRR